MDVFVSYSSKDTERTKQICDILRSNGISSWVAYENELYGENYATTIVNEIGAAKVFLVLVSEESNKSKHVINEINCASMHDKVILPVFLEDVKLSPAFEYYIAGNHWLNYSDTADFVQQFVGRISSLVGKPAAEEHVNLEVLPDEEDDIIPLPGKPAKPVEVIAPENPADLPEDMVVEPDEAVVEDSADSESDADGLKTLDSDALDSEEESDDIKDNTVKEKKKGKKLKVIGTLLLGILAVVAVLFFALPKDSVENKFYTEAEAALNSGNKAQAAILFGKAANEGYKDARERSFALWNEVAQRSTIAAGGSHSVVVKSDGTVGATDFIHDKEEDVWGYAYYHGECEVSGWTDIVAVAAGWSHTVGLKSDGTVVATGGMENPDEPTGFFHYYGECDVSGWTNIVSVVAGGEHTVGLKLDGTVVAVGNNKYGQCNVDSWTDIIAVSAGDYHTVGLKSDGTVVAVGDNEYGQCRVSGWKNIDKIFAIDEYTVGLKSDCTVVASDGSIKSYLNDFVDIVSVYLNHLGLMVLKSDGTVVVSWNDNFDVSNWTDIIDVSAGGAHFIGLKSDGTVVAVGNNNDGQCNVSGLAAESVLASGNKAQAAILFGKAANEGYADARERSFALWDEIAVRETISAGEYHTVGLKNDGTVVAVGDNDDGQCNVSDWKDIVAVSAGSSHTVGLKSDGTVVAVGDNEEGQCNVSDWKDIVAVSAGGYCTVGLKKDGTVVAVGVYHEEIMDLKDLIDISVEDYFVAGLKSDGTVVPFGLTYDETCEVSDWENIRSVDAAYEHILGVKSDGTVSSEMLFGGECGNVSGWKDIVAVSASAYHTVGLKSDGTVVAVGDSEYGQCDVSGWTDIVAVAAGYDYTVGLKADGTVVAVGYNDDGECDVGGWKDIKQP